MYFTNYNKAVQYLLHETVKSHDEIADELISARESSQRLMERLDNPQNQRSSVHVAGTSGKGTVCYLIDALLRAHTRRTGMTQSPHVYDIRERIQVNGQLLSEKQFLHALNAVLEKTHDLQPQYFEILLAMGFLTFTHGRLDYTIIETGFGGDHDASNVISSQEKVCVITQIGYEYTQANSETLAAIAAEKAAIIQPGNQVIALEQEPAINDVIAKICAEKDAPLTWVQPGETYQRTNDALASAACKLLAVRDGWHFDDGTAEATLQQVFIPGRFERRHYKGHLAILDGAHNPQKLAALTSELTRKEKAPVTAVLSLGKKKDIPSCIEALKPAVKRIIATEHFKKEEYDSLKAVSAEHIAAACEKAAVEVHVKPSPTDAVAFAATFAEPIVITGSFYILGEVDSLF